MLNVEFKFQLPRQDLCSQRLYHKKASHNKASTKQLATKYLLQQMSQPINS